MIIVVQRVNSAVCTVDEKEVSRIEHGLVVFVGVADDDTTDDAYKAASKLTKLRVFKNDEGKLSLSVCDVGGSIMVIPNFTLKGSVVRGNRPDCTHAAPPALANELYMLLASEMNKTLPTVIGAFGEHMHISVYNDGPVNIVINTKELNGKR